jgi:homoserine kinase
LIPGFFAAKQAALKSGALAASISGAGPTAFALCANEKIARLAAAAMKKAFGQATTHVGAVATRGAHAV